MTAFFDSLTFPKGEGFGPAALWQRGLTISGYRMRIAAWKASWLASARTRPVDTQSPTT